MLARGHPDRVPFNLNALKDAQLSHAIAELIISQMHCHNTHTTRGQNARFRRVWQVIGLGIRGVPQAGIEPATDRLEGGAVILWGS